MGLGLGEREDQRMNCGRWSGAGYPCALDLLHFMFILSHWAVVGFGSGRVGSFQSKKNDWD